MYGLAFLPATLAEWNALDTGIKTQLKKALEKRLKNPGSRERKTPRRFTRVLQNQITEVWTSPHLHNLKCSVGTAEGLVESRICCRPLLPESILEIT
jgi:hypothetical protein